MFFALEYALTWKLDLSAGTMKATAGLHLRNGGSDPRDSVSFLLYRLLHVNKVTCAGVPLEFEQAPVGLAGQEDMVVNHVMVSLVAPAQPGAMLELVVEYEGRVEGYADVWAYTKDRISTDFTLLRPDVLVYPIAAGPELQERFAAVRSQFDWTLSVTVPEGFVPACGGRLERTSSEDGVKTHVFSSIVPTHRIDLAVARFELLEAPGNLAVYFTPAYAGGAGRILTELQRVRDYFKESFGSPPTDLGCRVIQIPEGWGGQAGDGYVLQPASAFTPDGKISHLYHEAAHSWNAKPAAEVARTRWFDEAFAAYLEALAIEEFQGQEPFMERMNGYRNSFRRAVEGDHTNADTPIARYGEHELGFNSYTKGAWSLHVLRRLVGDHDFRELMSRFLNRYSQGGADFEGFQHVAEKVTGKDLEPYFTRWIYGSGSSMDLVSDMSEVELVGRCLGEQG